MIRAYIFSSMIGEVGWYEINVNGETLQASLTTWLVFHLWFSAFSMSNPHI